MPAKKSSKSAEPSSMGKASSKSSASSSPAKAPASKPRGATSTARRKAPSVDARQVAEAAYLNYCHRREQGLPENPYDDWLKAERELGVRK